MTVPLLELKVECCHNPGPAFGRARWPALSNQIGFGMKPNSSAAFGATPRDSDERCL